MVINQFIASFNLYLRSNISALQLFKTDSVLSVLDRAVLVVLCSLFIWGDVFRMPMTIEWYVYCQTISYCVTFLVALGVVLQKAGKVTLRIDRARAFSLFRRSLPFAFLALLMASYKYFDVFAIERLLAGETGAEQAGVYAQSFRLLDGISQYALLFAVLLLPIFSKMIKNKMPVIGWPGCLPCC
ncbi:MAG: oligosaccharide flippase family protein [Bacteroidales bacterium]|nr:oligosaccharide flippase family protein [Bacteroidales bacterium]